MSTDAREVDDDSIRQIIEALDAEVPKHGAQVLLHTYGGGPDECYCVANKQGYLRLGIEMLRAGYSESDEDSLIDVDIEYLRVPGSTVKFDWFERRDPVPIPPTMTRGEIIGCLSFLVAFAIIGGVVWFVLARV